MTKLVSLSEDVEITIRDGRPVLWAWTSQETLPQDQISQVLSGDWDEMEIVSPLRSAMDFYIEGKVRHKGGRIPESSRDDFLMLRETLMELIEKIDSIDYEPD